ncbi:YhjD/YihY/BrkB family envelope integrity protein [Embleya sp. NBC_00896]|uniref:YhjD/YihY/BrkB family envelope integrity protein n=1 Tax=Embleya sp. NBC_00896 TaxID=2975961 RepID=UPI003867D4E2|nr:YihY/virulence factor BrkB family protein [Embleya sp. NBC_00896]
MSVAAPARGFVDRLRHRIADLPLTPFLGRLTKRFLAVNSFEAATTLAAKAFLTGVPALFVFAAFAPDPMREQLIDSLRAVLGLREGTLSEVTQVYGAGEHLRQQTGVFSAVFTLLMAAQVARTLQRLCRRAWLVTARAPVPRQIWRWLLWLPAWLTVLLLQAYFHDGFGFGPWLGLVVSLVVSMLVWWWTQHLLLEGLIGWLPLLPGAVLAGAGMVAVQYASHLVMPRTVARSVAEFGPFGLVLTLMSWLIAGCAVVVFAITIGAFLAEEEPFRRWLGSPSAPTPIELPQD